MANVEKFKYWCNKILPLVYDDSLSYYEFLGKVYEKLNETIDAVNSNTEAVAEFDQRINDFIAAETAAREGWEDQQERDRQSWETTETANRAAWERQQAQKYQAFMDMFVDEYDQEDTYTAGDVCSYEGKMYVANAATSGSFHPNKWNEIVLAEYLADYVQTAAANMQSQYGAFLENYQRQFGVVDYAGHSTTDAISQNAATGALDYALRVGDLVRPSAWIHGKFTNAANGNYSINSSYSTCVDIPCESNTEYETHNIIGVVFFDANHQYISGIHPLYSPYTFTTPANAAYFNINSTHTTTALFDVWVKKPATSITTRIPFLKIDYESDRGNSTTSAMSQAAVTSNLNEAFNYMFRPAADLVCQGEWLRGKYTDVNAGTVGNNSVYSTIRFIPVSAETKYSVGAITAVIYFNASKQRIGAETYTNRVPRIITTPANTAYCCLNWHHNDNPLMNCYFVPATEKIEIQYPFTRGNIQPSFTNNGFTLDADHPVEIPQNSIKNNYTINFNGIFLNKGTNWNVIIGRGTGTSLYTSIVKVDSSNITIATNPESATTTIIPLEITIADTLNVQIIVDQNMIATVIVSSNGAKQAINNVNWMSSSTVIKASATNATLTNCSFGVQLQQITSDVWVFGDSYLTFTAPNRWPYYLYQHGFNKFLLNAFPGENSINGLRDLVQLLKLARPKMILWCYGMNDIPDNDSEPNNAWLTGVNMLIDYCRRYDIIPILTTIPTVPTRNHEKKNTWVRNSGFRYIDFAKAVGAQSNGTWYSGMLTPAPDGVHPTITGAIALYSEAVASMPELTL